MVCTGGGAVVSEIDKHRVLFNFVRNSGKILVGLKS
jgi:hypothetical protein